MTKMATMPIYGKTFKNLFLQKLGWLGAESVHKLLGTRDLLKLLKRLSYVDIWLFYGKVKFASLCICMSLITFVWENCWEFQTTSALKPLSQICSNFIWSLLRVGEQKIAEMVVVRWPRWPPCPYMVKTFKKSSSPELRRPWGTKYLHKSFGTGDLPKLLKLYFEIWSFYDKVRFASLCICMSLIHLYGTIV